MWRGSFRRPELIWRSEFQEELPPVMADPSPFSFNASKT